MAEQADAIVVGGGLAGLVGQQILFDKSMRDSEFQSPGTDEQDVVRSSHDSQCDLSWMTNILN